jgi:hypothetical protein
MDAPDMSKSIWGQSKLLGRRYANSESNSGSGRSVKNAERITLENIDLLFKQP